MGRNMAQNTRQGQALECSRRQKVAGLAVWQRADAAPLRQARTCATAQILCALLQKLDFTRAQTQNCHHEYANIFAQL